MLSREGRARLFLAFLVLVLVLVNSQSLQVSSESRALLTESFEENFESRARLVAAALAAGEEALPELARSDGPPLRLPSRLERASSHGRILCAREGRCVRSPRSRRPPATPRRRLGGDRDCSPLRHREGGGDGLSHTRRRRRRCDVPDRAEGRSRSSRDRGSEPKFSKDPHLSDLGAELRSSRRGPFRP